MAETIAHLNRNEISFRSHLVLTLDFEREADTGLWRCTAMQGAVVARQGPDAQVLTNIMSDWHGTSDGALADVLRKYAEAIFY